MGGSEGKRGRARAAIDAELVATLWKRMAYLRREAEVDRLIRDARKAIDSAENAHFHLVAEQAGPTGFDQHVPPLWRIRKELLAEAFNGLGAALLLGSSGVAIRTAIKIGARGSAGMLLQSAEDLCDRQEVDCSIWDAEKAAVQARYEDLVPLADEEQARESRATIGQMADRYLLKLDSLGVDQGPVEVEREDGSKATVRTQWSRREAERLSAKVRDLDASVGKRRYHVSPEEQLVAEVDAGLCAAPDSLVGAVCAAERVDDVEASLARAGASDRFSRRTRERRRVMAKEFPAAAKPSSH